jgi:hypothetical protein
MYVSTRSRWRAVAIGPIWVPGSEASPTASEPARAVNASTTSAYRPRGARTRVPRKQVWPLLRRVAPKRPSPTFARSRSASSRTIAVSPSLTGVSSSPSTSDLAVVVRPVPGAPPTYTGAPGRGPACGSGRGIRTWAAPLPCAAQTSLRSENSNSTPSAPGLIARKRTSTVRPDESSTDCTWRLFSWDLPGPRLPKQLASSRSRMWSTGSRSSTAAGFDSTTPSPSTSTGRFRPAARAVAGRARAHPAAAGEPPHRARGDRAPPGRGRHRDPPRPQRRRLRARELERVLRGRGSPYAAAPLGATGAALRPAGAGGGHGGRHGRPPPTVRGPRSHARGAGAYLSARTPREEQAADSAFHRSICETTRNPQITMLSRDLLTRISLGFPVEPWGANHEGRVSGPERTHFHRASGPQGPVRGHRGG